MDINKRFLIKSKTNLAIAGSRARLTKKSATNKESIALTGIKRFRNIIYSNWCKLRDIYTTNSSINLDLTSPDLLAKLSENSLMFSVTKYAIDQNVINRKIRVLTNLLKCDTEYLQDVRNFMTNAIGRKLAEAIILANEDYQDAIAKSIYDSRCSHNALKATDPEKWGEPTYLPPSYKDINVKAMLLSEDIDYTSDVFGCFISVLNRQAVTYGLTESERLLSSSAEKAELRVGLTKQYNGIIKPVLELV